MRVGGHCSAIEWRKITEDAQLPRTADYPRASLARTLELAAAVEELGGDCAQNAAAARLSAKPGGTFGALVSTSVKYGWIAVRRGRLRSEPRYREYRLAYDELERRTILGDAVRAMPLFRQLLERFAGRALPESHLPKLLIREYGVPERGAERVARYFVEAATAAGFLAGTQVASGARPRPHGRTAASNAAQREPSHRRVDSSDANDASYRVRISGPDVDSAIEIASTEDVDLVRTVLAKVERGLRERARRER